MASPWNCRRRSFVSLMVLFLLSMASTTTFLPLCSAQRAIVDLGKRLEKRSSSASSTSKHGQGEHDKTNGVTVAANSVDHVDGNDHDSSSSSSSRNEESNSKSSKQQQQQQQQWKNNPQQHHYYVHHLYTFAATILVVVFCYEQVRETKTRSRVMQQQEQGSSTVPESSSSTSTAATAAHGAAPLNRKKSRGVDSFLEQISNLSSSATAAANNLLELDTSEDGGQQTRQKPVDLSFEAIQLKLRKKNSESLLLDGSIHGRAQPGRMLAIMGPSGAGKSSLLHALAGRISEHKNMQLVGRRYLNGHLITGDSLLPAALIEQEVNFFSHMTVQETLEFRVQLKLGSVLTRRAQDAMVQDLLEQMGLTKARHTIVGDAKVRGISGGERKRLSIAVEMINSPSIIFLDEPTSGLDSTAASSLVENLRELANAGKTIVAVIHQPSQHVFAQFDDLLLLSEGRQMYYGPVDQVRSYMTNLGYKPEAEMGTAEHVIDCVSRACMPGEADTDVASQRVEHIAKQASLQQVPLLIDPQYNHYKGAKRYTGQSIRKRANVLIQFKLLLGRALAETFRGKVALIIKLVQQVSIGLIYGGIYRLGTNQASIQDRYGLLSLIAIGSMNMAVASTIRSFPREKEIVSNEIANKLYSTLPYFIAKALSEIPLVGFLNCLFGVIVYRLTGLNRAKGRFQTFLGLISLHSLTAEAAGLVISSISPNSDVALAIFPAVVVLNIIFDGKNISEENTPKLLRWIPKVGLIRWGFEGLCINEFTGLNFDSSGPPRGPIAKTGTDALARFGLNDKTVGQVFKAQLAIIGTSWVLSYLGLSATKLRFLVMKEPNGNGGNGNNKNHEKDE